MKIAFVSFYTAHPATSGAANVTYNCARFSPGCGLLIQVGDRDCTETISGLTVVSLRQWNSSRVGKFLSMPIMIWRIQRMLTKARPTHIVLEGASWAGYLLVLAAMLRCTLSMKLIYHAHNVEYLLRQEREGRLVASITRSCERNLLKICDQCFAVSSEDREHFARLYGVRTQIIPNGVACKSLLTSREDIAAVKNKFGITDNTILFMGLYAYPPNTEAVRFLIDQVMVQLYKLRPDVRLVITGGNPPDSHPWLIRTGVIPRRELNAVLGASRIGVAPIFRGSGTRLKILEYMAAGLPVVTTRKGAEGLNVCPDRHALFAENAEEFRGAILRLMAESGLRQHLSGEGRDLVRSVYDWAPILKEFSAQIENAS